MEDLEKLFRRKLEDDVYAVLKGETNGYYIQFMVGDGSAMFGNAKLYVRDEDSFRARNEVAWHTLPCIMNNHLVLVQNPMVMAVRKVVASGQLAGHEWNILSPIVDFGITNVEYGDRLGVVLSMLAACAVGIMTMPSTNPLPADEGTHKIVVTVAGDSEDDRIKGLLLMASRMIDKALRAPSHNDFVLDVIGVVRHGGAACFCLMGGETARTRGIIFWDVATMYHSIYFKWGQRGCA